MAFTDSSTDEAVSGFSHTLEQLLGLMVSISELEEAKAEAASTRQHQKIDGFLKEEQALILKLRGLEQLRMKQAGALGWQGLTFRQILERADGGQKELLSPLFDKMNSQLRRLTDSKDSADRILRLRLKELEEALAGAPQPHLHDTYG